MLTLLRLARTKGSVTKEVEKARYNHRAQRRLIDLSDPDIRHVYKSSTQFDGEGSNEADA